uniref:Uncharacterized protein n=1 Tax=Anguilla anguilla TaxID=7936 RepID=A0A0E9U3B6_ANGAN
MHNNKPPCPYRSTLEIL